MSVLERIKEKQDEIREKGNRKFDDVLHKLDEAKEKRKQNYEQSKNSEGLKVKTVISIIGITIFIVGLIGLLILNAC